MTNLFMFITPKYQKKEAKQNNFWKELFLTLKYVVINIKAGISQHERNIFFLHFVLRKLHKKANMMEETAFFATGGISEKLFSWHLFFCCCTHNFSQLFAVHFFLFKLIFYVGLPRFHGFLGFKQSKLEKIRETFNIYFIALLETFAVRFGP